MVETTAHQRRVWEAGRRTSDGTLMSLPDAFKISVGESVSFKDCKPDPTFISSLGSRVTFRATMSMPSSCGSRAMGGASSMARCSPASCPRPRRCLSRKRFHEGRSYTCGSRLRPCALSGAGVFDDTVRVVYTVKDIDVARRRSHSAVEIFNQHGEMVAIGEHLIKWLPTVADDEARPGGFAVRSRRCGRSGF